MKRLLLSLVLGLSIAAPVAAQVTTPDSATVHQVRRGDTLWDLAGRYLRNPYLWPEIYQLNRDVIANPNWIYPAERIRIPGLVVQPDVVGVRREAALDERTVFFPSDAVVAGNRLELMEAARSTAVSAGDYYRAGQLVRDEEIVRLGQLAEVVSPSIVPLETPRAIQPYDRVFMKLERRGDLVVGDRVQLVRRDRAVGRYGHIFISTGLATVAAIDGEVATVVVDAMHADVRPGDWAVAMARFSPVPIAPLQPAMGDGRILAFESPHAAHMVEDLAFVDLGSGSGVKEGDELVAVLPRTAASWGTRPEIEVARLRVVRASRSTSAVRVVAMQQPALEPGLPVRLVGRMP